LSSLFRGGRTDIVFSYRGKKREKLASTQFLSPLLSEDRAKGKHRREGRKKGPKYDPGPFRNKEEGHCSSVKLKEEGGNSAVPSYCLGEGLEALKIVLPFLP